jgi:hypothetical protein
MEFLTSTRRAEPGGRGRELIPWERLGVCCESGEEIASSIVNKLRRMAKNGVRKGLSEKGVATSRSKVQVGKSPNLGAAKAHLSNVTF